MKKKFRIDVAIGETQKEKLKELTEASNMTISDWIRKLVSDALANQTVTFDGKQGEAVQ